MVYIPFDKTLARSARTLTLVETNDHGPFLLKLVKALTYDPAQHAVIALLELGNGSLKQ